MTAPPTTIADDVAPLTAPPTTIAAAAAVTFAPVLSYTWKTRTRDNFVAGGTLDVGAVGKVDAVAILPSAAASGGLAAAVQGCRFFNPQTDGLVPLRTTATNETAGFDADINMTFLRDSKKRELMLLTFTGGIPSCTTLDTIDMARAWSVTWSQVPPGGAGQVAESYLVVASLYSPAFPSGDPSVLAGSGIWLVGLINLNEARVEALSGPGATSDGQDATFPIAP